MTYEAKVRPWLLIVFLVVLVVVLMLLELML